MRRGGPVWGDVNVKARALALVVGALLYAATQNAAWWPDLAEPVTVTMRIAGLVLRATSLIFLVSVIERMILRWLTRRIRGEWIYQENSGYWGYARIFLQASRLRYSVDLYKNRDDLLEALQRGKPVPTMGHGDGRVSFLHADGRFTTWYHVPAFLDYPERHGTLTLNPTNDPNNYHGRWERTGSLGPADRKSGDETAAKLARRDKRQDSGNFKFFMRKKVFLCQA